MMSLDGLGDANSLNTPLAARTAMSVELEVLGLLIHALYGFLMGLPITTYGEAITLLLQVN